MNLHNIKPGPLVTDAENDLPALLGHILTQVQFVPNIRRSLGWRGLRPSENFQHSWTARIAGVAGVFGVCLDEVETNQDGWSQATYRISYFPSTEESLHKRFSQVARAYTVDLAYSERINEFPADLDLAAVFEVGRFTFSANSKEDTFVLGLNGLSRRKISVTDGLLLEGGGGLLMQPGAVDENLPAFTLAYQLFKVVAASFTFVIGDAPTQFTRNTYKGWQYSRSAHGRWSEFPCDAFNFNDLQLRFGDTETALPTFASTCDAFLKRSETCNTPASPPEIYAKALWWCAHDLETLSIIDKRSLGIEDRPQLYVLSGFLGSGKTSFLQNFLEYQMQHHRFVAVVQNEVGEVSLDGKILDDAYAITELNAGTVCCSLVGELRPAIQNLLNNFHPDVIVIETSGAANPLGLQADIRALEDLVRFDSVTTIVDAEQFERSLNEYDVVADQVRAADVIVLNKTDLVTGGQLVHLDETLRALNPYAAMSHTRNGAVNPGLLYDFGLAAGGDDHEDKATKGDISSAHTYTHTHTHDEVASCKVDCPTRMQTKRFIEIMEHVPPNVFRIKGVVDLVGRGPTLVQFVGGRFNLSEFQNPNVTERFLVLIGHELDTVVEGIRSLHNVHDTCECGEGFAAGG